MAHGGKRENAGRKKGIDKLSEAKQELEKWEFNVIKEMIDMYNELDKKEKTLKLDILKTLLPYGFGKMPEQIIERSNEKDSALDIINRLLNGSD